jgi:uncharacterized repeat protein (TIGR01451 family)
MTCSGTYAATQADIDTDGGGNGQIENTATVSSDELADETDFANVPVVSSPAMTLVKASTTTLVTAAGQVIPYTFVITNTGNTTLTNVQLADNTTDTTPVCVPSQPSTLALGEVMNCTAQYTVTVQDLQSLAALVNVATATSNEAPPVQDIVTIPLEAPPPPPSPMVPVPVNSLWALVLLMLLVLGTAWHMQARQRRD